jgi:hypothetical protein
MHSGQAPDCLAKNAPVAQLDRAPDYESGGQEFESLRARHFGTKLGTPKPADFSPDASRLTDGRPPGSGRLRMLMAVEPVTLFCRA